VPSGSLEPAPSNVQVCSVQDHVKAAVGACGAGTSTVTVRVVVAVAPLLSVTVRRTVYVPEAA
jgi:hypothetical protein